MLLLPAVCVEKIATTPNSRQPVFLIKRIWGVFLADFPSLFPSPLSSPFLVCGAQNQQTSESGNSVDSFSPMQYATGVPHGQSVTTAVTTPTVVSWAKKFLSSTMCTTVSAVSSPHDTWDVESDLSSTDGHFTMKNDAELSEEDRDEVRKSCTANDTEMKVRVMEQSINMIVFNCPCTNPKLHKKFVMH